MAKTKANEVLSDAFLMDLFRTCMDHLHVLALMSQHVKPDHFPDVASKTLFIQMKRYYDEHKKIPPYSILYESIRHVKGAVALLEDTYETSQGLEPQECLNMLEEYLKRVNFQQKYIKAGHLYDRGKYDEAVQLLRNYVEWEATFSLTHGDYTNVVKTFAERFRKNRQRNNEKSTKSQVTRFYIDELDARNDGRDLRSQLTYILAATGVGKSHAARWIGRNACLDGLNVLHFQLEGSREEVENAYSAALVGCNAYRYERGTLRDTDFERMAQQLESVSGRLYVKSYPKFNAHVSTLNIKEAIAEFRKKINVDPDVVIIDSADLLTDSSGRNYDDKGERHKRVNVANDLKDLAADEDVWIVATYQSTVENRDWLNDEKNVFTEYNTAEAKGLSRPLTHLITLNQSSNEYREQTMRINVAKSRFFKKGDVFKIATDYDNEVFYDRARTMNINKVN